PAAARRTRRRNELDGKGAARRPRAPHPRRRAHGRADRARHEPRHGPRRGNHRARLRQGDRQGQPNRSAAKPGRHRGVSGGRRMTLLELRDLAVSYGPIRALKKVSITVETGEIVTLIGANGAGKTTTLKTISGLLRPSAGDVLFEGESIAHVPAHKLVKRGIGHAPEGRGMF